MLLVGVLDGVTDGVCVLVIVKDGVGVIVGVVLTDGVGVNPKIGIP